MGKNQFTSKGAGGIMNEINKLSPCELSQIEQFRYHNEIEHSLLAHQLLNAYEKCKTPQEICKLFNKEFKTYHFYFLVEHENTQTLFEYRTDRIFKSFYKNNLLHLSNYLTYLSKLQSDIDLKIYIVQLPNDDDLFTRHIFHAAKKEIGIFNTLMNWIYSNSLKISGILVTFFIVIFLGKIFISPAFNGSVEKSFITMIIYTIQYILINTALQIKIYFAPVLFFLGGCIYLYRTYKQLYKQHIKNLFSLTLTIIFTAFISILMDLSNSNFPQNIYKEMQQKENNQSRKCAESQCKNILASTSKMKVPQ